MHSNRRPRPSALSFTWVCAAQQCDFGAMAFLQCTLACCVAATTGSPPSAVTTLSSLTATQGNRVSELSEWDSFYVIVGSAAGALVGLQFVVMTLIAERPPVRSPEAGSAFATPTVLHFSSV